MSLFQKTVLKDFVRRQNQEDIKNAFDTFQAHSGNLDIEKNILAFWSSILAIFCKFDSYIKKSK